MFRNAYTPFDLSTYSPVQVYRLYCRFYAKLAGRDYHPYGIDTHSMSDGNRTAYNAMNTHCLRCFHD